MTRSAPLLWLPLVLSASVVCAPADDAAQTPRDTPPLRAEPARPGSGDEARSEVRATIVRLSVRVAESFPPQYFADIASALENGCARFSRAVTRRQGDTIFVDVFNTQPTDPHVACTMIYGERETAVALGSDFTSGNTYAVDANGTRETFVAQ